MTWSLSTLPAAPLGNGVEDAGAYFDRPYKVLIIPMQSDRNANSPGEDGITIGGS